MDIVLVTAALIIWAISTNPSAIQYAWTSVKRKLHR